jgi:hypothetical protein
MSDAQQAAFAKQPSPALVRAVMEAIKKPPKRGRGPNKLTLAAALKQATSAGLKPSAATIGQDGKIELRFGDSVESTATVTPLEAWKAKKHARST